MEIVGDDGGGSVRGGHEGLAVLNVLDGVEGFVLDDDAVFGDSDTYEVLFHAFSFGKGLGGTFAAGHDAGGGVVFAQVLRGGVQAVLEDGAGAVFADLGAKDDQVVQAGRRAAAEAAKNKSFTDCEQEKAGADGDEEEGAHYFGNSCDEAAAQKEAQNQKEGAQGQPDSKKGGAAADQEDHDAVQDACSAEYCE